MTDPKLTSAYWMGRYDTCRLLMTSPRMNRTQREIVEEIAYQAKDELEKMGIRFEERAS